MASQIRFDPPSVEGLVASGTTVAAAAERLGVFVELACGGAGECTSCTVQLVENPFALSEVTEAERRMLGDERLAAGIRLACQAQVREGDCVVRVLGSKAGDEAGSGDERVPAGGARERIFEEFEHLEAKDRLVTATELQIKAAGDLLGSIVEVPLKVGEELLTSIFGTPSESESKGKEGDSAEQSTEETHESRHE
jgi:2Fe-2S ferredoxin